MRVACVLIAFSSVAVTAGCRQPAPPEPPKAASPAPEAYGSLAQVMRSIPFPNSNVIFDTQTVDPGKQKTPEDAGQKVAGATATYAGVYAGWKGVENSAAALSETANLLLIPGRLCENGKPVPTDKADFRKWAQGLADAGQAASKAAQSRSVDAMVAVSDTVSDACAACHERYRDVLPGKERCI